jgi:hypothetical protein
MADIEQVSGWKSWPVIAAELGERADFQSVPDIINAVGQQFPEGVSPVDYVAAAAARDRMLLAIDRARAASSGDGNGGQVQVGFTGLSPEDLYERGAYQANRAHAIMQTTGVERHFVEDGIWRFAPNHLVGQMAELEYQLDVNGHFHQP